jgi:hypothetical protein
MELRGGSRCKEVDEHGGHARLGVDDGGALVQVGRRNMSSDGTAVAACGTTAVVHGTLAEWCLAAYK